MNTTSRGVQVDDNAREESKHDSVALECEVAQEGFDGKSSSSSDQDINNQQGINTQKTMNLEIELEFA